MERAVAVVLLVAVVLSLPVASGQSFLEPGRHSVEVPPGQEASVRFTLKNALNQSLAGFARLDGDLADGAQLAPTEFRLPPGGTRDLGVTISANALSEGRHDGTLRVQLVNQDTGATQRLTANLSALLPAPLLLFGTWEVSLPAPFDGAWGLFLVETAFWLAGAYVAMRISASGTKIALGRLPEWVQEGVVDPLRAPLFVLIFLFGLRWAWRFFPPAGWVGIVQGILDGLVVLAVAFLIFRIVDSLLLYVKEEVAPKTETKWDDIIVPVSHKLAIALLVGFAFFYVLDIVGVNLGFLVAGGLIVGLVLSNALGPTLQNLFSGLFLLLDRPFEEGDDVRLDTGEVCNVRKIGLRSTRLYFYRNHELIIAPNKDLENARIVNLNYPDKKYKMHIQVGVAYGSPIEQVRALLEEVPDRHPEVYVDEELRTGVFFDDFGESALLFRLVVFVEEVGERFRISSELRDMIDESFRAEGITIPFPQRTLWTHDVDRPTVGPGTYAEEEDEPGGAPPGEDQATDPEAS